MNLRYAMRVRKFRNKRCPGEIDWMMQQAVRGTTLLDIGAHKGGWTYWMNRAAGPAGRVVAFEPQPLLNAYLHKLLSSKQFSTVSIENMAVSTEVGELTLSVPASHGKTSPGASLKTDMLQERGETHSYQVPTTSLDAYLEAKGTERVSFLKVDVEGAELDVILGATKLLERDRPSWVVEAEARHAGEDGVRRVLEIMREHNYEGFFFKEQQLTPVDQFSFKVHQRQEGDRFWDAPNYCNNFAFAPR